MEKRTDMRAEALDTLIDIERNKKLSHIAIGETLMRNQFEKKADRAFYTRLCEGVTERKIYLDYILDHYSKTPMKKCKPLIRSLLRMGAYQILFMDVRDAAACSEAVSLAKKRGFGRLSGFVNGVLRTLVREKENLPVPDKKDDVKYVSITYSVPEWLSKLIIEQYGKESAEKIFASFLEARPLTIRTNLSKTTPEELEKVENLVNEKIQEQIPVVTDIMDTEEAKKSGAMALFGEKYGDKVRVVSMGDFSKELCGGTHVKNTAEIGLFKLVSEAGVAAGVRRIEALTGPSVTAYYKAQEEKMHEAAALLKTTPADLLEKIAHLQAEAKALQAENESLKSKLAKEALGDVMDKVTEVKGVKLLAASVPDVDMNGLRDLGDQLKEKLGSGVVVLASAKDGKVSLLAMVTDDAMKKGAHAGKLIKEVAAVVGGGGGGRPNMAQAGGKNPEKIDEAVAKAAEVLEGQIA